MLSIDYSKKVLHIAVRKKTVKPSEPGHKGKKIHQGLVFNPFKVFAGINASAESYFAEFFTPSDEFWLVCVETEMGPAELRNLFDDKFQSRSRISIGGIVAPFEIEPIPLERLWSELAKNPKKFYRSKEKRKFS